MPPPSPTLTAPATPVLDRPFAPPAPARPRGSRLARNVFLYGLGNILSRLVALIMLPVYTRYLTPGDYGILQLLEITVDVVVLFVSAGALAGLMRIYFKTEPAERGRVMATAFYIQFVLDGIGALIMFLGAPTIHHLLLRDVGEVWMVRVAAVNFWLLALYSVPVSYAQLEQRGLLVTVSSLVKLVVQLSCNILFVVAFRWGPGGIILSTFVTNLVLGVPFCAWLLWKTGLRASWPAARSLRRFGLPYQAVTAGTFILAFGDRFVLERSHGVAEVGIYGLAYQFGFLVGAVATVPFMKAWDPIRHQIAHLPRRERDQRYSEGFLYFALVHMTLVAGLVIFAHPFVWVMTTPAFRQAGDLIPIIAVAYLFQGLNDVFDHGLQASERTILATYATWAAVVVVVVLYLVLIPPYGAWGAAAATLVAFVARAAFTGYLSWRVWPIRYRWARVVRLAALAVTACALAYLTHHIRIPLQIALDAVIFLGYLGSAWLWVLGEHERANAIALGRSWLARVRGPGGEASVAAAG